MAAQPLLEFKPGQRRGTLDIDGRPGEIVEVNVASFMQPGTPYQILDGKTVVGEGVWHGDRIPVRLPPTGVARYVIERDEPGEVA